MNPHIELVKKFLADNDSVTEKELRANKQDAYDAFWAAADRAAYDAFWAADRAAYEAAYEAAWAADANYRAADEAAKRWKELAIEAIAKYEELTK